MPRKYRKPSIARKVNYLSKMVNRNKPELKQIETSFGGALSTVQTNQLLCEPDKGTNSNQRVGDEVKAVSYYGVFYFNIPATTSDSTQSVRLIHYLTNKPNEAIMEDNGGSTLTYNRLPADKAYIIQEDKLITLSKQGPACRKVILKGKFKYQPRLKWETDNNKIDWHPRMLMMSDVLNMNSADNPQVQGQIRYYYTDA